LAHDIQTIEARKSYNRSIAGGASDSEVPGIFQAKAKPR